MIINKINDSDLNNLIRFAISNCTFYYNKFKSIDIHNYSQIPYLTQEEIAKNSDGMKSTKNIYRTSLSSGTTGLNKVMYRTVEDIDESIESQIELMKWCGVTPQNVVGIAQPFGLCAYGDLTLGACKKMGIMAIPMGNIENQFILEYIKYFKIDVLDISPSKLSDILDMIEKNQINVEIKILMVSGEAIPTFLEKRIERVLKGKMFNQYGTEEVDALAGASKPGDSMKILDKKFIYEIKDVKKLTNGKALGELVVTSLYHKGTPIIKYATGDYCEYDEKQNEIQILGRNMEYYNIYDSVMLYPFQMEQFFKENNYEITSWQSELIKKDGYSILTVKMKSSQCKEEDLLKMVQQFKMVNIEIFDLITNEKLKIYFVRTNKMSESKSRKHKRFIELKA